MKKIITTIFIAVALVSIVIAGGKEKLTIKEKIDQAEEVKTYFVYSGIGHSPHTVGQGNATGTGCAAFSGRTEFPEGYKLSGKILELLNKGLKTEAFKEADINTVPVKDEVSGVKIYDWLEHGEKFVAIITISGDYEVNNAGLMGEIKLENSLSITAYLNYYEIIEGKLKIKIGGYLAVVSSDSKPSDGCDGIDYFEETFPASSLLDAFIASIDVKTVKYTENQMKKYEKAMKKKK